VDYLLDYTTAHRIEASCGSRRRFSPARAASCAPDCNVRTPQPERGTGLPVSLKAERSADIRHVAAGDRNAFVGAVVGVKE